MKRWRHTNDEIDVSAPLLVNEVERVVCERERRITFATDVMRTRKDSKHRKQETCPKLAWLYAIETNNTHPYGSPYSPALGFAFLGFLR